MLPPRRMSISNLACMDIELSSDLTQNIIPSSRSSPPYSTLLLPLSSSQYDLVQYLLDLTG